MFKWFFKSRPSEQELFDEIIKIWETIHTLSRAVREVGELSYKTRQDLNKLYEQTLKISETQNRLIEHINISEAKEQTTIH